MRLYLNGEEKELPGELTVKSLLDTLGLRQDEVAVEVNAAVVRRERRAEHALNSGDRIEIVTFVGGG